MDNPAALFDPPFEVIAPSSHNLPMVFNSPHSGRVYPRAFLAASRLDSLTLRRSEDAYVEELFAFAREEQAVTDALPKCARFYEDVANLISLKFRYAEARDLALTLNTGSLPVAVRVVKVRTD